MKLMNNFTKITTCLVLGMALLSLPTEAQKNQLTDPEIASIAVTANQVDIDYAKIAEKKIA
jgi:putative membrane protein